MIKTLFLTLFAAFFLIGGMTTQAQAHCGVCEASVKAQKPCAKCIEAGKVCECGSKKPCEKTLGKKKPCDKKPCTKCMDKKPCAKCAEAKRHYGMDKHDSGIRTGAEVNSNIGSLKMKSGIAKDSYN